MLVDLITKFLKVKARENSSLGNQRWETLSKDKVNINDDKWSTTAFHKEPNRLMLRLANPD